MFLDMAARPELCPAARKLADQIVAANRRRLQDPRRLAELIAKLGDPSAEWCTEALVGLRDAGAAGVEALTGALADSARHADRAVVRRALAAMGSESVGAMLAMRDGGDAELKLEAVRVLAELEAAGSDAGRSWRRV